MIIPFQRTKIPRWWRGTNSRISIEEATVKKVVLRGAVNGIPASVAFERLKCPGAHVLKWTLGRREGEETPFVADLERAFCGRFGYGDGTTAFAQCFSPVPDAASMGFFVRKGSYLGILDSSVGDGTQIVIPIEVGEKMQAIFSDFVRAKAPA